MRRHWQTMDKETMLLFGSLLGGMLFPPLFLLFFYLGGRRLLQEIRKEYGVILKVRYHHTLERFSLPETRRDAIPAMQPHYA